MRECDGLYEVGTGVNPSLTNLILHGPIDKDKISDNNLNNLIHVEKKIGNIYTEQVLPKLEGIFRSITRDDYSKISNKRLPVFKKRNGTDIRNKLRESYRGDFTLDQITSRALFSRDKFCGDYGQCAKFWFTNSSEYMLSFRHKKTSSIKDKLNIRHMKIKDLEKHNYLDFVIESLKNNYTLWQDHDRFKKVYGKDYCETLLNDLFGLKIVDTDMDRFFENSMHLGIAERKVPFFNFNTIKNKNHIERNKKNRPGGFHIILEDKALPGFTLEIQYRSLQDEIFNMLGENSSFRYKAKGKKVKKEFDD